MVVTLGEAGLITLGIVFVVTMALVFLLYAFSNRKVKYEVTLGEQFQSSP